MKVSVLIPTYNRRQYVVDAVRSVLAQDYDNLEIVVVDDGSTDGTESALAPYRSSIRYIRTENQGPAMARNTGMLAARGDYVAWLDSDDLYYPFKIRLQAQLLDDHPDIGMVYTEFSAFSDDGFWDEFHLKKYHASAYQRGGIEYGQLFVEHRPLDKMSLSQALKGPEADRWVGRSVYFGDIYEAYLFNVIVFTNSMMFRRSLLETAGLQRKKFGMFHDLEFALRLCRNTRVAFVDVPAYKLRYHPDQISTTRTAQGGQVAIRIQRDLLRVAEHHLREDPDFYLRNEGRVRGRLAKLCRAAAIPLIACDSGSVHGSRRCSLRARHYLAKCREYGSGEALLYALTFSPHIVRRVAFKLMSVHGAMTARKRAT
jgi:glycosyltransferase involved in cell wall biosynthesis